MKDFYKVLGISPEAASTDIKKAYFKLVKLYPPDRYADEFMRIREAYETLIDENTRRQYDDIQKIPEVVRAYYIGAGDAMAAGDNDRAIDLLEKVIKHYTEFDLVMGMLGDAYLANGNSVKAISIFEELSKREPKNAGFSGKLAAAYLNRGWHKKAQQKFIYALKLDLDNISLWLGLIECHIKSEDFIVARNTAIKAISTGKSRGWDVLDLYFHIIQIDIYLMDFAGMQGHVDEMKNIAREKEDEKENVAWFLVNISKIFSIFDRNDDYDMIIKAAFELIPEDRELKKIVEKNVKDSSVRRQINKLKNDSTFDKLFADMFKFELEKCGRPSCGTCKITEVEMEMYSIMHLTKLKKQIIKLGNSYPDLYALKKGFFDELLKTRNIDKLAYKYNKVFERLEREFPEEFEEEEDDYDSGLEDMDFLAPQAPILRDENKVGRNDPCSCGSGKKYKKCCGK